MTSSWPYPPSGTVQSVSQHLLRYLKYFHASLLERASELPSIHVPLTPSGWSATELLNHVAHMERRWLVWDFLGQHVDNVWGAWHDGSCHAPHATLSMLHDALAQNLDVAVEVNSHH
ncbi:hypothetical protein [Corynebacterium hindlerae]|uniref:hypothetical protein n=1 Tax=Corynebacterium hindlerae TaxID=699041 RepID=UPI003AAC5B0F